MGLSLGILATSRREWIIRRSQVKSQGAAALNGRDRRTTDDVRLTTENWMNREEARVRRVPEGRCVISPTLKSPPADPDPVP